MSKTQKPKTETKSSVTAVTYSIHQKDSGYYIIRHKITNGEVTESTQVSEPDVLIITMSNLEKFVRKQFGI